MDDLKSMFKSSHPSIKTTRAKCKQNQQQIISKINNRKNKFFKKTISPASSALNCVISYVFFLFLSFFLPQLNETFDSNYCRSRSPRGRSPRGRSRSRSRSTPRRSRSDSREVRR